MTKDYRDLVEIVLQLIRQPESDIPEDFLYGLCRLFRMNDSSLAVFAHDYTEDIRRIKMFMEARFDLTLMSSGIRMFQPTLHILWEKHTEENAFGKRLKSDEPLNDLDKLVRLAIESSLVDLDRLFGHASSMELVTKEYAAFRESHAEEVGEIRNADRSAASAEKEPTREQEHKKEDRPGGNRDLEDISAQMRRLTSVLLDRIKGQDHAVLKFVRGIAQGELLKRTERENRPRATFFFFGPPGVGKTYLAETAAQELGLPHKIFNMSEYASDQSFEGLIGIADFYKSARQGDLVKFVSEHPECVLVFDEIEKAHLNTIRLFLQILGSGCLQDVNKGKEISFRDAVLIFTSNVGRSLYNDRNRTLSSIPDKVLIDAIASEKDALNRQLIPPELCSRIASSNVVIFDHLPIHYLAEMVADQFERVASDMLEEFGCSVSVNDAIPLLFLFSRGDGIDARIASGKSAGFMKNEICEIIQQMSGDRTAGQSRVKHIHMELDWEHMDRELLRLFRNDTSSRIVFFTDQALNHKDWTKQEKNLDIIVTGDSAEAHKLLEEDAAFVVVDPFCGMSDDEEDILSIADYDSEGVRLFHWITESRAGIPVFVMQTDDRLLENDIQSFRQEGAMGTIRIEAGNPAGCLDVLRQQTRLLHMESEAAQFGRTGCVIACKTKQIVSEDGSEIRVIFYDLKKRLAVDTESANISVDEKSRPKVRFSDVIGAENAKEELRYFVDYLKNPKKFRMNGGELPRGILLYGPGGTGKTTLAKALAGEAGVFFIATSAAEFKNVCHGGSEENVRRVFRKARRYAPSVIFIDEIDAIGKQRTGSEFNRTDESTLNVLLTEMDGFFSGNDTNPVFVIAATNFAGRESEGQISGLDQALLQRFSNRIYVDLPNVEERAEFIRRLIHKKKLLNLDEDIAVNLARRTTGKSLRELDNVLKLALRKAAREGRNANGSDFLTALEEYEYGEKKEHTQEYYEKVAIHEAGHAYICWRSGETPSYVTIESRGEFGGYMQHSNQEDTPEYTRAELLGRIRTSLAGRAAEQVFFGEERSLNTGASSDLRNATNLAFSLLCSYGMEDGQLIVLDRNSIMKSAVAGEYLHRVNDLLSAQMVQTLQMVEEGRETIRRIADALIARNRLTDTDFLEIVEV